MKPEKVEKAEKPEKPKRIPKAKEEAVVEEAEFENEEEEGGDDVTVEDLRELTSAITSKDPGFRSKIREKLETLKVATLQEAVDGGKGSAIKKWLESNIKK